MDNCASCHQVPGFDMLPKVKDFFLVDFFIS